MELVNLVRVVLNRVGSASGGGFTRHSEIRLLREVPDISARGLMDLVKELAVENGEPSEALQPMQHSLGWNRDAGCEAHVFNVQGPGTFYSSPYAECSAFPALKVGDRYFRLEEIAREANDRR